MSFKRSIAYNASNTADFAAEIKDRMVAAGWTLHDDQSGASPPKYIMKSNGEVPLTKVPCYLKLEWASSYADKIQITTFLYWNESTHAGVVQIGSESGAYIYTDDDAAFYGWVWTNKDFVIIVTKIGATYYGNWIMRYAPGYKFIGHLQSSASSGSNVTLQLGKGQTRGAVIGANCMVICLDGTVGRDHDCTITAIDADNDTIEVNALTYTFPAGSVVGFAPYPWIMSRFSNTSNQYSLWAASGTSAYATSGGILTPLGYQYVDPEELTQLYMMTPLLLNRSGTGYAGYVDRWVLFDVFGTTSYEDTVAVGVVQADTVATGGGADTLADTAQTWTPDEHIGRAVIIISGTGAGQIRTITDNDATSLTVDENWSTNPDSTSHYVICEEAYRHFGFNSTSYARSIIEGGYIAPAVCYELTTTTTTTTTTTA